MRLQAADLFAQPAVALCLSRLLLQTLELLGKRRLDIVEPQQIVLGRPKPLLGLLAARLQPRDAGRLLQQQPAFCRSRLDQCGDAALADNRARLCARRRIGEQQLHIARPRLAAVDAVNGAGAALDSPHDLDPVAIVDRERRIARAVIENERDFGDVGGRTAGGPGKDHIVHRAAAHPPRRGLTHHPAQRVGEVGLAAAIGPDDSGQPRLDRQLGAVGERFEPGKAKPLDLHRPRRGLRFWRQC